MPLHNYDAGRKGEDKSEKSATEGSTIPVKPKLNKRFYEALLLLNLVNSNQGEHIEEKRLNWIEEYSNLLDKREAWRSFLKSVAYLCDKERGGSTVTALLSEQTPQGVVLWIASNTCSVTQDGETSQYLEEILCRLVCLREENSSEVREYIVTQSLAFCLCRLTYYQTRLGHLLRRCTDYLENQDDVKATILNTWLRGVESEQNNLPDLCRKCYKERHSPAFAQINYFIGLNQGCAQDLMELRHFVGRLGQNIKAATAIVHAAQCFPQLFDGIRVERRPSSMPSRNPLNKRNPTLSDIIGRVTSDVAKKQEVTQVLVEMDDLLDGLYSKELKKKCQNKNWKPRVHAELILLNWAYSQEMTFVDGDKYIACSKPACYCCYLYILDHPGHFAEPACHNNSYLNWRAPDVVDGADKSKNEKTRESILNKMAGKIRENAIQQILQRRGRRDRQHDSTTGISPNEFAADEADQRPAPRDDEPSNRRKAARDKLRARAALTSVSNRDSSMTSSPFKTDSYETEDDLMTNSYDTADGEFNYSESDALESDGGASLEQSGFPTA